MRLQRRGESVIGAVVDDTAPSVRTFDQSLVDLRAALERAAGGDLQVSLDPDAIAPALAPLARALNRLAATWREAVDARQRSEARYRALVEEGHAVVYLIDLRQGNVHLMMDTQMEAMLGYKREEWQADFSLLKRRLHPDDRERVLAAKTSSIEHGSSLDIEYRLLSRHGATVWVHDHATVQHDTDGRPVRIHGVAVNITTRRHVEEALRESEHRFERMARRLPHVIFRWSAKGLEYISPACLQMFGRTPGELLRYDDPRDLLIHPDDRARVREVATNLMGGPVQFEARLLRPNGDAVWTEQNLLPIFDGNGWLVAVEGVACDISERKRMEAVVRESEELFHTLAELSPVGIFRTDAFGKWTYLNEHGRAITGRSFDAVLGHAWAEAVHPDDRERVASEWHRAVYARSAFRAEYRFQHRDGRIRWVLGQALPETNAAGDLRGHVGTITDITDRKHAEQALLDTERSKREAACSAADLERRRLARELHDGALQDLSAVKLLLEVERKQERAERLDPALERLTGVITELRAVVDNLQPGDLSRASLQEAIAAHAKWLSRPNGIALTLELDPSVCIAPTGIRDLYRIAQEALANAVRHGGPSRIIVRLHDESQATVLEIEDDGIGFDATGSAYGMGLLSMRERAAALGGELEIASTAGKGTCVRVAIPADDARGYLVAARPAAPDAVTGRTTGNGARSL